MSEEMNFDDEIDLRAIAQTIWNARLLIVIAVAAIALLAFAVSSWVLPRKYQASAYLLVKKPVAFAQVDPSLFNTMPVNVMPALADLAKAASMPDVLEPVLKDPAVVAAFGYEAISLADLTAMSSAAAQGLDTISLQVTDTDPGRAALLANAWAEQVSGKLNATYSAAAIAQTLVPQVTQSQKAYQQAQAALEEAIAKSSYDAVSAQRNRKQADLEGALASISRNARMMNDLQLFEKELGGLAPQAPISPGDGLVLTALRQRSLTALSERVVSSNNSQVSTTANPSDQLLLNVDINQAGSAAQTDPLVLQIDSAALANITASDALESIARLRAVLQGQLTQLQGEQSRLEQELPQLQRDLEQAQAQLSQLRTLRDYSLKQYTNLIVQQSAASVEEVASLSAPASAPAQSVSPNVLKNTALAGMAGLMLAVLWVLLQSWWQTDGVKQPKQQM